MATITSTAFAEGLDVELYASARTPGHSFSGSALDTQTVADGVVTFEDVEFGEYVLVDENGRELRAAAKPDAGQVYTDGEGGLTTKGGTEVPVESSGLLDVTTRGVLPGLADITDALEAAQTEALADGNVLVFPAGGYNIAPGFELAASVIGRPGARLVKTDGSSGDALVVTGDNVLVEGLAVDGNRTGLATGRCVRWVGDGGVARDCSFVSSTEAGLRAEGEVTATGVECSDHTAGGVTGDGFFVPSGGKLVTERCIGNENGRAGFFFSQGAADGCQLEGRAERNGRSGATIRSFNGRCTVFVADDNTTYGVDIDRSADKWVWNFLERANTGKTAANSNGTALEMFGGQQHQFGSVICRGNAGYGVALTSDSNNSDRPSAYNDFAYVSVDRQDAADSDPAVYIGSGSNRNHIGTLRARRCTLALSIGEGHGGANDHNVVDKIIADACTHAIALIHDGSHNRIGPVIGYDCETATPVTLPGLVIFMGADTTGNTVERFEHTTIAESAPAAYVVEVDGASGNHVGPEVATLYAEGLASEGTATGTTFTDFSGDPPEVTFTLDRPGIVEVYVEAELKGSDSTQVELALAESGGALAAQRILSRASTSYALLRTVPGSVSGQSGATVPLGGPQTFRLAAGTYTLKLQGRHTVAGSALARNARMVVKKTVPWLAA